MIGHPWPRLALVAFACLLAGGVFAPRAGALPAGFSESAAIDNLELPTAVRFAPDGHVFVAEKSGLIKVFDGVGDTSATVAADLRTEVYNSWDRGLLGIALDPGFAGNRYLYALYTRNAKIGEDPERWPTLDGTNDDCPGPVQPADPARPGPLTDGCVVSGRLVRLQLSQNLNSVAQTTVLIEDQWCQQFPSHSVGSLAFDPAGNLYVSAGDGANYGDGDWGQSGLPRNPCGDPPSPVGTALSPPSAEGGVLRSQDLRTSGDPTGLDGAILRISPANGDPAAGNPLTVTGPDLNARRIVAYGFRNPFRIAIRPGTGELWVGDVGWGLHEEINRLPAIIPGSAPNFGWPCFEAGQALYEMLSVCQTLHATPSAVRPPLFSYQHGQPAVSGDGCETGSSSTSGLAFEGASSFPSRYADALFFADYARSCIWAMRDTSGDGVPDPGSVEGFSSAAGGPVDLQFGPGGALYYADIGRGQIREVSWGGPVARATATPSSGEAPLTVSLSAASSSDPTNQQLSFAWDLDEDGAYDDSTQATLQRTYTARGHYEPQVRVRDPDGNTAFASAVVDVDNGAPVPSMSISPSGAWRAGQLLSFSGSAVDPDDGQLPPSALDWQIQLVHCPNSCHDHPVSGLEGDDSGTFTGPEHEFPSHLLITLTATDSDGRSTTIGRTLDPQTSLLTVTSDPAGLLVGIGAETAQSPLARRQIVGSSVGVSTISPQPPWSWQSWSDGGEIAHDVAIGPADATVTAGFSGPPVEPPLDDPGPPVGGRPTCRGKIATVIGGDQDERLAGTPKADTIAAGGGDDRVRGADGRDLVCGGGGDDDLRGNGGGDRLTGGGGADLLRGGPGEDRCADGPGDELRGCER